MEGSVPATFRVAFVGGLATLGVCLMWIGATMPQHPPPRSTISPIALVQPEPLAPAVIAGETQDRTPTAAATVTSRHPTSASPILHFRGTIQSSLFEAAMAQGVPAATLHEMIRVLSYDIDFQRDIQPGDQFDLMAERGGDARHAAKLLYAAMILSGKKLALFRYTDGQGGVDYYTQNGESVRKALLKTPVDGARISSGFGKRFHPILHYTTEHKGIDFAVMPGTPVMAAGNGVIDYAGVNGSYGLYVRIRHDASHATAYAHLSRMAPGMRRGRQVTQGQTIAFSGASGRATGPHLHYEVLVNDSQANPVSVKFQSGRKLTGKELLRFQAVQRQTSLQLAATAPTIRTASRND